MMDLKNEAYHGGVVIAREVHVIGAVNTPHAFAWCGERVCW